MKNFTFNKSYGANRTFRYGNLLIVYKFLKWERIYATPCTTTLESGTHLKTKLYNFEKHIDLKRFIV